MAATTTKQLLTDLKTLGLQYSNDTKGISLSHIKTWKRGVLAPQTVFPAVTFVPTTDLISGFRNGGVYKVDHEINIEVHDRIRNIHDSSSLIQSTCISLLDMFYDTDYPENYKMKNDDGDETIFAASAGQIRYQSYQVENQYMQTATIPMIFSGFETAPAFTKTSTITDTDSKSIGEYVTSLLKNSASLSKGKFFYSHSLPPISVANGFVICVLENNDTRNRRETGRDNPNTALDIIVWTKLSPHEASSLDYNLDQVEIIKDVLMADQNLGGRACRTKIANIDYDWNTEKLLYGSVIRFNTWSYNRMPSV